MVNKDWETYFLDIAYAVASKSKDPSTKVGCIIVDSENRIVSTGYNGFIRGCNEAYMTQERPMKYQLVIHAEMNAVLFSDLIRLDRAICYVTHAPCPNCLKHLMQTGITEIMFDKTDLIERFSDLELDALHRLLQSRVDDFHCWQYKTLNSYQWIIRKIQEKREKNEDSKGTSSVV